MLASVISILFFSYWYKQNAGLKRNESENRSVVSHSLWPHGLYSPWNSPGQNTGVGSCSILQGIFPAQGSNPGLPHCRQILYQLSHQGSPQRNNWVQVIHARSLIFHRAALSSLIPYEVAVKTLMRSSKRTRLRRLWLGSCVGAHVHPPDVRDGMRCGSPYGCGRTSWRRSSCVLISVLSSPAEGSHSSEVHKWG